MTLVHFVVPAGIDDPGRPSGGNAYDRRLCDELRRSGWTVREHLVPGSWPTPDRADHGELDHLLAALPDGSVVLVDGLIASGAECLVSAAGRLRIGVLVHMPDATGQLESAVLQAVAVVITTSRWSRERIMAQHGLPGDRVIVAVPGVDEARPSTGTGDGRNLLVVGPVVPAKGHDILVAALTELADLTWNCTCVGALDLAPEFVRALAASAEVAGIGDRLLFTGPLARPALDDIREHMDLVISTSRREAYGMAVAEGLACGIPVVGAEVGGLAEVIGPVSGGSIPGVLVPDGDVDALASALRQWLTEPATRTRWRQSAALRRQQLPPWAQTAQTVTGVLAEMARQPGPASAAF